MTGFTTQLMLYVDIRSDLPGWHSRLHAFEEKHGIIRFQGGASGPKFEIACYLPEDGAKVIQFLKDELNLPEVKT